MARTTLMSEAERRTLEQQWAQERRLAAEYGLTVEVREALAASSDDDLAGEIVRIGAELGALDERERFSGTVGLLARADRDLAKAGRRFDELADAYLTTDGSARPDLLELASLSVAASPGFAKALRARLTLAEPAGFDPAFQAHDYGNVRAELNGQRAACQNELQLRAFLRGDPLDGPAEEEAALAPEEAETVAVEPRPGDDYCECGSRLPWHFEHCVHRDPPETVGDPVPDGSQRP